MSLVVYEAFVSTIFIHAASLKNYPRRIGSGFSRRAQGPRPKHRGKKHKNQGSVMQPYSTSYIPVTNALYVLIGITGSKR